jgi:periplasmic divalent cation tolerance protein
MAGSGKASSGAQQHTPARKGAAAGMAPGLPEGRDVVVVFGNAPDLLLAKRIAHVLVEESLVACATLGAPCLSMYMWNDTLEGADEIPLILKTTRARAPAVLERLRQLHPDEIPEALVLPVSGGLDSYLDWVVAQTSTSSRHKEENQ